MYDAWLKVTYSISDSCKLSHFNLNWSYFNKSSRVSQKGVINVSVSDHQLIFCTRKIYRIKTGGAYKYLNFRSLKNYTADYYKEALKQVDCPNYENFGDVDEAYSNIFQKLMTRKALRNDW